MPGEAVGRADQEVARAHGRVADLEGQDGLLGLGAGLALDGLVHYRVQGGVQQALHQGVGGVVGAGGLALVASELGEAETGAVGADLGGQGKQALVDPAQFLGAEVLVVHRAQDLALAGVGQVAQGFEEVVVGQLGVVKGGGVGRVPEEAAEGRQGQGRAHGLKVWRTREGADQKLELAPQVAVAAALDLAGQVAQASGAVVGGVTLAGGMGGVGVVPGVEQGQAVEGAILGHEQEDEPVDQAQELAVQVGGGDLAGAQAVAQGGVLGVAGKALAEDLEGPLHPAPQFSEGAGALFFGELGPLLQPAGLGALGLALGGEAGGVGAEPEQHEVGEDLAGKHGLQVEFQEGLARKGLVVAQQAQAQAVADQGPEVAVAAIEELLDQPVGIGGGGPADTRGAAVEAQVAADQVDGHRSDEAVDGVVAAVDGGAGAGRERAEA